MPAWIEPELTTATFLWTIERRDGVTLGFTTHDQDLVAGGIVYRSAPGMLPSAIERSDSLTPDDVELTGALTSDAITSEDLLAGRWDGAALRLEMADWTDTDAPRLFMARGELGSIETRDGAFTVQLRGPAATLDAPVTYATSPDCRAILGDKKCRISMIGRRFLASVVAVNGTLLSTSRSGAPDDFAFGTVRWIGGANSGLESRILASVGAQLTLDSPPHFPAVAGDLLEVIEGCDKRFSTCVQRFSNAANFRGEPHLPGNDLLTRYASG